MSMTYVAIIGFVDDAIPFVVEETPFLDWRCRIPVLPQGGGEDQPIKERTAKCQHRTRFLVGRAPTCEHHIRYAVGLVPGLKPWLLPTMPTCPGAA